MCSRRIWNSRISFIPRNQLSAGRRPGEPATVGMAAAPSSNRSLNDVQSLLDHHQPGRHRRAVPGRQPLRRQPCADAGRLSGLRGADRARRRRRPRTRHGAVGNAVVVEGADGRHQEARGKVASQRQVRRFQGIASDGAGRRHDQHPQREEQSTGRDGSASRTAAWCRSISFSEFNKAEGGDIWFALDESRPLACFAGIWTNWTSVRKVKEGETTNDIFAFLTTEPNAEVGAIHPNAMPVILTTPDEVETWMTASSDEALKLQRPLPDGALRIVARGIKEDPAGQS